MKLTKERQKETGAFYTPKIWADLAVTRMREAIQNLFGKYWDLQDFAFWDMACGEGALLDALPKDVVKYGTTLEWDDVEICRDKGYHAFELDFLAEKPATLKDFIREDHLERLIVFCNPPYFTLPASNNSYAKKRYKSNSAEQLFLYRMYRRDKPFAYLLL